MAGLLAGLIALAIPSFGMTFGGIALLTLIGALVGAWSAALAGSALPNPVRRAFGKEIDAGRILVVIDAAKDKLPAVEAAIAAAGAAQLPFDMPSAMT